jgi:hypothetical protein
MIAWIHRVAPWAAELPHGAMGWLFAFSVLVLLFLLLCVAMRLGRRVSLGGPRGFVFEATSAKSPPTKKGQP